MKNNVLRQAALLVAAVLLTTSFWSCSKEEPVPEPTPPVVSVNLHFHSGRRYRNPYGNGITQRCRKQESDMEIEQRGYRLRGCQW